MSSEDKDKIEQVYHEMYRAMVNKDRAELERLHADDFVLRHMTGMHQSKEEYINCIMDGTLNYYSEQTEGLDIKVDGDVAVMTGRSKVTAAVFGGGRHTWRLQLRFTLARTAEGWMLTGSEASTY